MTPSSLILALLAVAMAAGCTSVKQTFPAASAEQLWTAMVTVAQNQEYPNWKVASNDVWIDEADRRIEVYRRLHRVLFTPQHDPRAERRTWRFEVRLTRTDPPEAKFTSRGLALPAHARQEANLYFTEVTVALGGLPEEPPEDEDLLDALGLDDEPSDY